MATALEIRVVVREVYGRKQLYPANLAASAIADIAGTKTLQPQALKLAKQRLGAVVLVEQHDAAYVAALLT